MLYNVFRVRIGMGLVDYCGAVEAASLTEAEDIARLLHPFDHATEKLDIELEEPPHAAR